MELKIGTFNIRVNLEQDGLDSWKHRADKVSALIEEHDPVVLGVQEALLPMTQDMETALPDYRWIGEGRRGGMSDEFCPIFYNHRLVECEYEGQFWLSDQPEVPGSISWDSDFPRICTWGHFRFKQAPRDEFIVYNTHLDHISLQAREKGIALIWEKIYSHYVSRKIPVVLMGDFNSIPRDRAIRFIRGKLLVQDAFSSLEALPGKTFHQFKGGTEGDPIDYIFCTTDVKVKETEIDRRQIKGRYPSDHYPVFTTLEG
ncbi:endonuclease/exonuclease/phosphatase family protein [Halobacillus sp. A5]|uniref:endonuclease/exonuclease/phosphatase family protein n=1 Tax=Halobacillus sp. A5 TaxID=2880263 RepID=UPI0020A6D98E|nr:endonuclease/exonuclease/phosphatase family protein [Halobacillus sp. A5]MCP3028540.1 endonuclease/exonuclease/phosphatase family protein [Halobacillus sp. A5]